MIEDIRAIIFDFDGLILDTEGPIYQSWRELFAKYDLDFPFSTWSIFIGTKDVPYGPYDLLEEKLGGKVDRQELEHKRQQREDALILEKPIMPGVERYLQEAHRKGLKLAVASSSSCDWVTGHLDRLGLLSKFVCVKASDDVEVTKPNPAVYLAALACLEVKSTQAIAIEDSPNGILAAKRAGLTCIAVPNLLTRQLNLEDADLQLTSLNDLSLGELLAQLSINGRNRFSG
ncbi:MAG: HAD family hydrolase [Anaerolineales bacterium]|nr:HAD family hydrolase [Anaerolineales bacterium]